MFRSQPLHFHPSLLSPFDFGNNHLVTYSIQGGPLVLGERSITSILAEVLPEIKFDTSKFVSLPSITPPSTNIYLFSILSLFILLTYCSQKIIFKSMRIGLPSFMRLPPNRESILWHQQIGTRSREKTFSRKRY